MEAIETLVALLKAESRRPGAAAAEALLSRGWGTPTAHIETGPPGPSAQARAGAIGDVFPVAAHGGDT